MNNIKSIKDLDKYMDNIELNIKKYDSDDIEKIMFNTDEWLILNNDNIDFESKDYKKVVRRIQLIKEHNNNIKNNKSYKTTRILTIVNTIFLFLGFVIAYLSLPIKNIGPDYILKNKYAFSYIVFDGPIINARAFIILSSLNTICIPFFSNSNL